MTTSSRGGRVDTESTASCPHIDGAMIKAIARAFRREMLENGTHATIEEIAAAEKINESLSLLAPDIWVGGSRPK